MKLCPESPIVAVRCSILSRSPTTVMPDHRDENFDAITAGAIAFGPLQILSAIDARRSPDWHAVAAVADTVGAVAGGGRIPAMASAVDFQSRRIADALGGLRDQ